MLRFIVADEENLVFHNVRGMAGASRDVKSWCFWVTVKNLSCETNFSLFINYFLQNHVYSLSHSSFSWNLFFVRSDERDCVCCFVSPWNHKHVINHTRVPFTSFLNLKADFVCNALWSYLSGVIWRGFYCEKVPGCLGGAVGGGSRQWGGDRDARIRWNAVTEWDLHTGRCASASDLASVIVG